MPPDDQAESVNDETASDHGTADSSSVFSPAVAKAPALLAVEREPRRSARLAAKAMPTAPILPDEDPSNLSDLMELSDDGDDGTTGMPGALATHTQGVDKSTWVPKSYLEAMK